MGRRFFLLFLLTISCSLYAADFLLDEFSISGNWSNINNRYEIMPDLRLAILTDMQLTDTVQMDGTLRFSVLADGFFFGADDTNDLDIEGLKDAFASGRFSFDVLIRQCTVTFHLQNAWDVGVFIWRGEKLGCCADFPQKSSSRLNNGPLYSRTNSAITEFDGIHPLSGIGANFNLKIEKLPLDVRFYTYTNPSAVISFDSRCIFSSEQLLFDSFLGISIDGTSLDTNPMHFGISALCSNKMGAELFIETGVTKYIIGGDDNYKNLYCFFEPRLQMEHICLSMAFFHHPEYYNGEVTNNGGAIDWNIIRIAFGNYLRNAASGGFELTGRYLPAGSPKLIISPFFAYKTGTLLWQSSFDIYPLGLADEPKKSLDFKLSVKGVTE